MDRDDYLSSYRCRFDIDVDEELKALKKPRPSCLDADNVDSLLNSSRWDVKSVKLRTSERDRPKSRESEIESKTTIACLKREIAEYKDQNAKLYNLVQEQKQKLDKSGVDSVGIDLLKERTNITVSAVQKECQAATARIVELESRVRSLTEEREKLEVRVAKAEKQLFDFSAQALRAIGLEGVVKSDNYDQVIEKLQLWFKDHVLLRGKQVTTSNDVERLEREIKEHKTTIEDLMKQSSADLFKGKYETVLLELNSHKLSKTELEKEVDHLKARVETLKNELDKATKQTEETSGAVAKLDAEKRQEATNARNFEAQYTSFRMSLAAMLSDPYSTCPAREDDIKERIRGLQQGHREKSDCQASAESRLKELHKKFEQQYESHHAAEKKAREAEKEVLKLQEKLAACERELGAGDVFRDTLKDERSKYQKTVVRIAKVLKMDKERVELEGPDAIGDSIIRRIEKLLEKRERVVRLVDDFEDCRESESSSVMRRKLEKAKEQIEAKDAHLEVLRKKLAQLEERSLLSRALDDTEQGALKKLEKRLKKAEDEVSEAKHENARLKAELLDCQNLRLQAFEQDKDIQALEKTLEKLEKVRQKQAVKIVRLKSAVGDAERDVDSDERPSSNDKIRTLKRALEETKRYERALREFRVVVGRLVGLNMASSTVTDAEILSRLEKLLRSAGKPEGLSIYPSDLSPEFREGYKRVDSALARHHHHSRSPSPKEPKDRLRSSSLSRGHRHKSPVKVDSRQY